MTPSGWVQLALFLGILGLATKPVGLYLGRVLDPRGKTPLDRVLKPLERLLYRILGVDVEKEQDWKRYLLSIVVFSAAGLLFTYAILRLQHVLPLNPQKLGPVRPDLAFNTAASFTTNTNWQNYSGERTLSYFSQLVGLVFHNFVSAAAGLAFAAALVRGLARQTARAIGNFWVDLVRTSLYLLLPASVVLALFLMSQGVVENFKPYTRTAPVAAAGPQTIAQGPAASQVAIKMLGTNGGGFFNANAAHPYENPTPLSSFIQLLAIFLIPAGLTYHLGRQVGNRRHGWADLDRHGDPVSRLDARLLAGGERRQSEAGGHRRGSRRREHGGQGSSFRRRGLQPVRRRHDLGFVRRGQRDARFLHPARRAGAALQHPTRRHRLRRRRLRPHRHAGLRRSGRFPHGLDGRPDARVSGQKNRGLRRQGLRPGGARHGLRHPRLHEPGGGRPLGTGGRRPMPGPTA